MSKEKRKAKLEVLGHEAQTLRYLSMKSPDDEVRKVASERLEVIKEEIEKIPA